MRKITSSLFLAALAALCLHVAPAQAQLSRTFVSAASGNDANNCDRPTPCRTFQAAHNKTNSDGEITVLDPGGYGGLTITKSISIVNDGVGEASILVSGGTTGITINGGSSAYVNLRGITIQGIGFGGGAGLRFNSGFSLTITNCVIRNHTKDGIQFLPNSSARLAVFDTLVSDNGGSGIQAAWVSSAIPLVVVHRSQIVHNSFYGMIVSGGVASGFIDASVADSVISNNFKGGFLVQGAAQSVATLVVVRSVVSNNDIGFRADTAGTGIYVGESLVARNTGGAASGAVYSFGDNYSILNTGSGDTFPLSVGKN